MDRGSSVIVTEIERELPSTVLTEYATRIVLFGAEGYRSRQKCLDNISREMSRQNISREMSRQNISREMSRQNISRKMSIQLDNISGENV